LYYQIQDKHFLFTNFCYLCSVLINKMMNNLKNIAVFCGSSRGRTTVYADKSIELARYFVKNNITMINGGGSIGLMGIMADEIIALGGKSIGVIPLHLKDLEVAHSDMDEMLITHDMAGRMKVIVEMADAFITLPGGFGTLDELFEVLTLSQLNIHNKPVGLLNINGFFDPLLQMLDKMKSEGYLSEFSFELLLVDQEVDGLCEKMRSFEKPGFSVQKIIDAKTEKIG